MNGSTGRAVRRTVDRALKPVGGRLVTRAEEAAIERRHRSLVRQLHDAYASSFRMTS